MLHVGRTSGRLVVGPAKQPWSRAQARPVPWGGKPGGQLLWAHWKEGPAAGAGAGVPASAGSPSVPMLLHCVSLTSPTSRCPADPRHH